jgi:hypothetical protein
VVKPRPAVVELPSPPVEALAEVAEPAKRGGRVAKTSPTAVETQRLLIEAPAAPIELPPAASVPAKRGRRAAVKTEVPETPSVLPVAAQEIASTADEVSARRKRAPRSAARAEQPAANGTAAEAAPRRTRARRTVPESPNGTAAIVPDAPPQAAAPTVEDRESAPAAESAAAEGDAPRRARGRRARAAS